LPGGKSVFTGESFNVASADVSYWNKAKRYTDLGLNSMPAFLDKYLEYSNIGAIDPDIFTAEERRKYTNELIKRAEADKYLTLRESNRIYRANKDENTTVTVDASKLTVRLEGDDWRDDNTREATVIGTDDWLVHGTVTVKKETDGTIKIQPESYDFEDKMSTDGVSIKNNSTLSEKEKQRQLDAIKERDRKTKGADPYN